jgi:hypothetical protein
MIYTDQEHQWLSRPAKKKNVRQTHKCRTHKTGLFFGNDSGDLSEQIERLGELV